MGRKIIGIIVKSLRHKDFPNRWIWQGIRWEDVRLKILEEIEGGKG